MSTVHIDYLNLKTDTIVRAFSLAVLLLLF